jgi:pimeloyl-ACP methyl ester carboxylesterase
MSVSAALGERRAVEVPAGTIEYRERGSGPPVVFVHGVGVNGDLWRRVVPRLAGEYRCIAPDLPFGSHSRPLRPDTDMSLPGLARIVADFIEALGLDDVAVVANDTGGAVAQWLVGHHPERIGRLVLTSCDAFDKSPPAPQRYLKPAARVPLLLWCVARSVRLKAVQRMPTAYGWTTRAPIDATIMRSYTEPVGRSAGVRRDLACAPSSPSASSRRATGARARARPRSAPGSRRGARARRARTCASPGTGCGSPP